MAEGVRFPINIDLKLGGDYGKLESLSTSLKELQQALEGVKAAQQLNISVKLNKDFQNQLNQLKTDLQKGEIPIQVKLIAPEKLPDRTVKLILDTTDAAKQMDAFFKQGMMFGKRTPMNQNQMALPFAQADEARIRNRVESQALDRAMRYQEKGVATGKDYSGKIADVLGSVEPRIQAAIRKQQAGFEKELKAGEMTVPVKIDATSKQALDAHLKRNLANLDLKLNKVSISDTAMQSLTRAVEQAIGRISVGGTGGISRAARTTTVPRGGGAITPAEKLEEERNKAQSEADAERQKERDNAAKQQAREQAAADRKRQAEETRIRKQTAQQIPYLDAGRGRAKQEADKYSQGEMLISKGLGGLGTAYNEARNAVFKAQLAAWSASFLVQNPITAHMVGAGQQAVQFAKEGFSMTDEINRMKLQLFGATRSKPVTENLMGLAREIELSSVGTFKDIFGVMSSLAIQPSLKPVLAGGGKADIKKLVQTVQMLGILNPFGMEGAQFIMQEMMSGELYSVGRRLNVTPEMLLSIAGSSRAKYQSSNALERAEILGRYTRRVMGEDTLERFNESFKNTMENTRGYVEVLQTKMGEGGIQGRPQTGFYRTVTDAFIGVNKELQRWQTGVAGTDIRGEKVSRFDIIGQTVGEVGAQVTKGIEKTLAPIWYGTEKQQGLGETLFAPVKNFWQELQTIEKTGYAPKEGGARLFGNDAFLRRFADGINAFSTGMREFRQNPDQGWNAVMDKMQLPPEVKNLGKAIVDAIGEGIKTALNQLAFLGTRAATALIEGFLSGVGTMASGAMKGAKGLFGNFGGLGTVASLAVPAALAMRFGSVYGSPSGFPSSLQGGVARGGEGSWEQYKRGGLFGIHGLGGGMISPLYGMGMPGAVPYAPPSVGARMMGGMGAAPIVDYQTRQAISRYGLSPDAANRFALNLRYGGGYQGKFFGGAALNSEDYLMRSLGYGAAGGLLLSEATGLSPLTSMITGFGLMMGQLGATNLGVKGSGKEFTRGGKSFKLPDIAGRIMQEQRYGLNTTQQTLYSGLPLASIVGVQQLAEGNYGGALYMPLLASMLMGAAPAFQQTKMWATHAPNIDKYSKFQGTIARATGRHLLGIGAGNREDLFRAAGINIGKYAEEGIDILATPSKLSKEDMMRISNLDREQLGKVNLTGMEQERLGRAMRTSRNYLMAGEMVERAKWGAEGLGGLAVGGGAVNRLSRGAQYAGTFVDLAMTGGLLGAGVKSLGRSFIGKDVTEAGLQAMARGGPAVSQGLSTLAQKLATASQATEGFRAALLKGIAGGALQVGAGAAAGGIGGAMGALFRMTPVLLGTGAAVAVGAGALAYKWYQGTQEKKRAEEAQKAEQDYREAAKGEAIPELKSPKMLVQDAIKKTGVYEAGMREKDLADTFKDFDEAQKMALEKFGAGEMPYGFERIFGNYGNIVSDMATSGEEQRDRQSKVIDREMSRYYGKFTPAEGGKQYQTVLQNTKDRLIKARDEASKVELTGEKAGKDDADTVKRFDAMIEAIDGINEATQAGAGTPGERQRYMERLVKAQQSFRTARVALGEGEHGIDMQKIISSADKESATVTEETDAMQAVLNQRMTAGTAVSENMTALSATAMRLFSPQATEAATKGIYKDVFAGRISFEEGSKQFHELMGAMSKTSQDLGPLFNETMKKQYSDFETTIPESTKAIRKANVGLPQISEEFLSSLETNVKDISNIDVKVDTRITLAEKFKTKINEVVKSLNDEIKNIQESAAGGQLTSEKKSKIAGIQNVINELTGIGASVDRAAESQIMYREAASKLTGEDKSKALQTWAEYSAQQMQRVSTIMPGLALAGVSSQLPVATMVAAGGEVRRRIEELKAQPNLNMEDTIRLGQLTMMDREARLGMNYYPQATEMKRQEWANQEYGMRFGVQDEFFNRRMQFAQAMAPFAPMMGVEFARKQADIVAARYEEMGTETDPRIRAKAAQAASLLYAQGYQPTKASEYQKIAEALDMDQLKSVEAEYKKNREDIMKNEKLTENEKKEKLKETNKDFVDKVMGITSPPEFKDIKEGGADVKEGGKKILEAAQILSKGKGEGQKTAAQEKAEKEYTDAKKAITEDKTTTTAEKAKLFQEADKSFADKIAAIKAPEYVATPQTGDLGAEYRKQKAEKPQTGLPAEESTQKLFDTEADISKIISGIGNEDVLKKFPGFTALGVGAYGGRSLPDQLINWHLERQAYNEPVGEKLTEGALKRIGGTLGGGKDAVDFAEQLASKATIAEENAAILQKAVKTAIPKTGLPAEVSAFFTRSGDLNTVMTAEQQAALRAPKVAPTAPEVAPVAETAAVEAGEAGEKGFIRKGAEKLANAARTGKGYIGAFADEASEILGRGVTTAGLVEGEEGSMMPTFKAGAKALGTGAKALGKVGLKAGLKAVPVIGWVAAETAFAEGLNEGEDETLLQQNRQRALGRLNELKKQRGEKGESSLEEQYLARAARAYAPGADFSYKEGEETKFGSFTPQEKFESGSWWEQAANLAKQQAEYPKGLGVEKPEGKSDYDILMSAQGDIEAQRMLAEKMGMPFVVPPTEEEQRMQIPVFTGMPTGYKGIGKFTTASGQALYSNVGSISGEWGGEALLEVTEARKQAVADRDKAFSQKQRATQMAVDKRMSYGEALATVQKQDEEALAANAEVTAVAPPEPTGGVRRTTTTTKAQETAATYLERFRMGEMPEGWKAFVPTTEQAVEAITQLKEQGVEEMTTLGEMGGVKLPEGVTSTAEMKRTEEGGYEPATMRFFAKTEEARPVAEFLNKQVATITGGLTPEEQTYEPTEGELAKVRTTEPETGFEQLFTPAMTPTTQEAGLLGNLFTPAPIQGTGWEQGVLQGFTPANAEQRQALVEANAGVEQAGWEAFGTTKMTPEAVAALGEQKQAYIPTAEETAMAEEAKAASAKAKTANILTDVTWTEEGVEQRTYEPRYEGERGTTVPAKRTPQMELMGTAATAEGEQQVFVPKGAREAGFMRNEEGVYVQAPPGATAATEGITATRQPSVTTAEQTEGKDITSKLEEVRSTVQTAGQADAGSQNIGDMLTLLQGIKDEVKRGADLAEKAASSQMPTVSV